MMSKTLYCQTSSNKFPKTVTGAVDFGRDTFTVFTLKQKAKILEKIWQLEDCNSNAILDSAIIAQYKNKSQTDSATIALYAQLDKKEGDEIKTLKAASQNQKDQMDNLQDELNKQARSTHHFKVMSKLGTGLGTSLGLVGGIVVGFVLSQIVHIGK